MQKLTIIAIIAAGCTSPNREHTEPEDLCSYDPPPIHAVFRVDGDGEPKGWTGFLDGRQVHWTRYEDGAPYSVVDGALRARCYPDGTPAETCIGDPADGCTCYLPDGTEDDCEVVWPIISGYAKADLAADGVDSAR